EADRSSGRRRSDGSVAAGGNEAPADERDCRVRVDARQLAERVEEQDSRGRLSPTELRAADERNRPQQSRHDIESLRFTRRDDHETIFLGDETLQLRDDDFVLALARRSEDEDAAAGAEGAARAAGGDREIA